MKLQTELSRQAAFIPMGRFWSIFSSTSSDVRKRFMTWGSSFVVNSLDTKGHTSAPRCFAYPAATPRVSAAATVYKRREWGGHRTAAVSAHSAVKYGWLDCVHTTITPWIPDKWPESTSCSVNCAIWTGGPSLQCLYLPKTQSLQCRTQFQAFAVQRDWQWSDRRERSLFVLLNKSCKRSSGVDVLCGLVLTACMNVSLVVILLLFFVLDVNAKFNFGTKEEQQYIESLLLFPCTIGVCLFFYASESLKS